MANRINPAELFADIGIPFDYFVNPKPGQVPFMVYYGTGSANFHADDGVYQKNDNWNLELYVRQKDPELEAQIESILDENEIIWTRGQEVYIDTEAVFLVPYYI